MSIFPSASVLQTKNAKKQKQDQSTEAYIEKALPLYQKTAPFNMLFKVRSECQEELDKEDRGKDVCENGYFLELSC